MSDILKLSVSKVGVFEECKARYKFSYILRLPKKERDYHVLGSFTHKVLENFHLNYLKDKPDNLPTLMSLSFKESVKEFESKLSPQIKKEAYNILKNYLARVTLNKVELDSVLALEKNFEVPLSQNVILNGMIDRIQLDPDGIYRVIDYKTTKNKKYLENEWFQLLTYAYVLYLEHPEIKKVRASYILLRHDSEYMTTEFPLEQILRTKEDYIKYANDIVNESEYVASPSRMCQFCDFYDICESGRNFIQPKFSFGEVKW